MTSGRERVDDGDEASGPASTDQSADALADRVAELEQALSDLRRETIRPPRGPLGLPRPPTPAEFVTFTERHAIPATIAFLEANVRALQALQAALRMARGVDETRDRTAEARARTAELGSRTLDALDDALEDLADAYREGSLPNDPEARSVLRDAQRLTDEIRGELDDARRTVTDHTTTAATTDRSTSGIEAATEGDTAENGRIDPEEVETELDVLRAEFRDDATTPTAEEPTGGDDSGPDVGAGGGPDEGGGDGPEGDDDSDDGAHHGSDEYGDDSHSSDDGPNDR